MTETYECKYCHLPFKSEKRLEKHNCKKKIRFEEIHSVRGQAAWQLYCEWFRTRNMHVPEQQSFLNSKYYNAFLKFSDFIKQMKINDSSLYIDYMVKKDNSPMLWVNMQIYSEYLHACITAIEPKDQVAITVEWLDKYAGVNECSIKYIVDKLSPAQIMDGIRQAKFLPWYFLHSPKFSRKIKQFNKDLQKDFTTIVNVPYWTYVLDKNQPLREEIRKLIKQIET